MPAAPRILSSAAVAAFVASAAVAAFVVSAAPGAPQYAARQEGGVVRLYDANHDTAVAILTDVGNIAFEMKVKGHNVFHWPYPSREAFTAKPALAGNPLLAPFANRLDGPAFFANGRRYALDTEFGNVRAPVPIHGFVQFTDRWTVLEVAADEASARVTSRLDFYRYPDWMQQWPSRTASR